MIHDFTMATSENFQFKANFTDLIKLFLNGPESGIINGGVTTQYFQLKRGARHQGDHISAYLFILCVQILFILTNNKKIYASLMILNFS